MWKLNKGHLAWNEISIMPNDMYNYFVQSMVSNGYILNKRNLASTRMINFPVFRCIGGDNIIILYSISNNLKALVYDLSQNLWYWFPTCPNNINIYFHDLVMRFPFSPRLDAAVC